MRWKVVCVQRLALLSGLVCGVGLAYAQGEAVVRGQIVATATGFPLDRAMATLKPAVTGPSAEAPVDAAGRFAFQNVRPGEYILSGSSDGFASRELRILVEPRETRTVTLALDIRQIAETIAVTAGIPALSNTHSPSSTLLTADRLESLPLSQRLTLSDAIVTAAPGMIRGHDDFVHIRGEEVALNPLINGIMLWENSHSVFSAGFSPEVIETANVMTGGFPAEYGSRFGGVVDVVTKSGFRMDRSGSVTLNAGEAGRRSASGEFGGHRDRLGYYMFGSMFESDRFLSPPAPEAIHDHAEEAMPSFRSTAILLTLVRFVPS